MQQMLNTLKKRANTTEQSGFTLIELMVVLLIIAILMLIAIPTFLGARTKAQNRAAQTDLRNALTAESTAYTSSGVYSASTTTMKGIEPSLDWVTHFPTTTPPNQIGVRLSTAMHTVCLFSQSASGTEYEIMDVSFGYHGQYTGTYYVYGNGVNSLPTYCTYMNAQNAVSTTPTSPGVYSTAGF